MKKALFTVLLLCSALSASAQAKYSIRAGIMGVSNLNRYGEVDWDFMFNINSNIRMARGSKWIFSPGATFNANYESGDFGVCVPLQVGYTGRVTSKMFFIPKVGLSAGYMYDFVIGPTFELGFEMRHFTFGFDGFFSVTEVEWRECYNPMAIHFNLGYVF